MASPDVLDFEAFLAPIPGERPVGQDPRADLASYPIYHKIRDARAKARRAERSAAGFGDSEDEALRSEAAAAWQQVLTLSQQLLTEQAKDLEIVSYLTEALLRCYGFSGVRDGFRLARLLVERYWDDLYPRVTNGSENPLEVRVKPLSDLNGVQGEGTLIEPLRQVPITAGEEPGPFGLWQYQSATGVRQNAELLEKINSSARASPIEFYKNLIEDLRACATEYDDLIRMLSERCGNVALHSSNIRSILGDLDNAIRFLTKDIAALQDLSAETTDAAAADARMASGEPALATPVGVATISGREEAFSALLHIAKYFRQTEPHSLISYTLEELVRRGRLPFIELLNELVPDDEARRNILLRAGIAPPAQDQGTQE